METIETTNRDHFTLTANKLATWKRKQEYTHPACSYFKEARKRSAQENKFEKKIGTKTTSRTT